MKYLPNIDDLNIIGIEKYIYTCTIPLWLPHPHTSTTCIVHAQHSMVRVRYR